MFTTGLKIKLLSISLIFLLWFLRYQMLRPLELKEGTKIRIRGVLREEPSVFGQSQSFSLQGIKIKTRRFPEYHYGDYLIITGRLKVRVLEYPEIKRLEARSPASPAGGSKLELIFKVKSKVEEIYNSVLPEPQASLLAGIVLGSKRGLPYDFWQSLKKTGTMHVVVASGANISLVSQPLIENLSGFLSRTVALPIAFVFIWLYTIMAGFEPPVVRAAIMASFAFTAQFLGREKQALWSLLLSAILMLFANPMVVFDLGFQLSFAATLGILLFYKRIKPFFRRLSFFGDSLSTTLAAQVLVLPIIYYHFREFSFISPLANSLVLWTIAPIMQIGAMIAVSGLINSKIAQLLAYPAWLLLTIFVKVIECWR